jgi:hypothetical protein
VVADATYEAAYTQFNLDQIAYDTAIARADPKIVARKLIAAAAYAPESETVRSATKSEIEPSAVLAQPGTAQAGQRATPLPETSEISVDTAATSLTDGVEADIQKIPETLEVAGSALEEMAASLQVNEQDLLNDLLDGEDESA